MDNGQHQKKNRHAAELSKLGAAKGGRRAAALARWGGERIPKATFGSEDRPLRIGKVEIPCYVLDDGRRVLAQRGIQGGIGMSTGGARVGAQRLAHLVRVLARKGCDVSGLLARIEAPILFTPPHGGNPGYGYEATVLPDLCKALANARPLLQAQQQHLADQADVLLRGLANVAIVALVDEVTGYQLYRAQNALAEILERFIAKELRPWVRTFPPEFYSEMFRLRGWAPPPGGARPMLAGLLTNDLVYKRLAPGVHDELQKVSPRDDRGRLKFHLHRRLTEDLGHPKLREHLAVVVAFMQISRSWPEFLDRLNQVRPKFGDTRRLALPSAA
jgi:hypothetical protein